MELVRLTVVLNEFAVEEIRSFLQTVGIESIQRKIDLGVAMVDVSFVGFGACEILVNSDDLEVAWVLVGEIV